MYGSLCAQGDPSQILFPYVDSTSLNSSTQLPTFPTPFNGVPTTTTWLQTYQPYMPSLSALSCPISLLQPSIFTFPNLIHTLPLQYVQPSPCYALAYQFFPIISDRLTRENLDHNLAYQVQLADIRQSTNIGKQPYIPPIGKHPHQTLEVSRVAT